MSKYEDVIVPVYNTATLSVPTFSNVSTIINANNLSRRCTLDFIYVVNTSPTSHQNDSKRSFFNDCLFAPLRSLHARKSK